MQACIISGRLPKMGTPQDDSPHLPPGWLCEAVEIDDETRHILAGALLLLGEVAPRRSVLSIRVGYDIPRAVQLLRDPAMLLQKLQLSSHRLAGNARDIGEPRCRYGDILCGRERHAGLFGLPTRPKTYLTDHPEDKRLLKITAESP